MSGYAEVALVAAHLMLQDLCVCGHTRQKHTDQGDFCFSCRHTRDNCDLFVPATAVLTLGMKTAEAEMRAELAAEERSAVDKLLARKDVRAAMSAAADPLFTVVERLLKSLVSPIVETVGTEQSALNVVEAAFLGWYIGFNVTHQDPAARQARIRELLAIVQHAAEQSGAVSAQIERRFLH